MGNSSEQNRSSETLSKQLQNAFSRMIRVFRAARKILVRSLRHYWVPKIRTNSVSVSIDDLVLYGVPLLFLMGILGGIFGFLGFFVVWISIGLAVPSVFANQYSLPIVVFPGTITFALIGAFRNRIVKRGAKQGFASLADFRFKLEELFWSAVILAIYGMLARTRIIPEFSISLSVFLMGTYFLMATPRFIFGQITQRLREARLSMKQFLLVWNQGSPEASSGHQWLRKAMGGVAERLKMSGLRTSSEDLFVGSSYSVFKGTISDSELGDLAEYIIKPSDWFNVNWTIPYLLSQSEEAEKAGFTRPRSIRNLFLGESTLQTVIQFFIVVIFGILEYLLRHFGFIPTTM